MIIDLSNRYNDISYCYYTFIPVSEDLNNDVPIYCRNVNDSTLLNSIKSCTNYSTSRFNQERLYYNLVRFDARIFKKYRDVDAILSGGGLFCRLPNYRESFYESDIEPLAVFTCKESYLLQAAGSFNTEALTLYLSEELINDSRNKKYYRGLQKVIKQHELKVKFASRKVLKKLIFGEPSMILPKIDLESLSYDILTSLRNEYEISLA